MRVPLTWVMTTGLVFVPAACATNKKSCEQFAAHMREIAPLAAGNAVASAADNARTAAALREQATALAAIRCDGTLAAACDRYVAEVKALAGSYATRAGFVDPTALEHARAQLETDCK